MNREQIIRMAREAGLANPHEVVHAYCELKLTDHLEHFAALVAAVEREKVAAWMMQSGYATGHGDTIEDFLKELDWQAMERERKACAQICVGLADKTDLGAYGMLVANTCANEILTRGQA